MDHDTLSDVLRNVRLRGAVFFSVSGNSGWVAEATPCSNASGREPCTSTGRATHQPRPVAALSENNDNPWAAPALVMSERYPDDSSNR